MKNYFGGLLVLTVLISGYVVLVKADVLADLKKEAQKAGKAIAKETKKAAKSVQKKVLDPTGKAIRTAGTKLSDPATLAKDAAYGALKTMGIDAKGIEKSVADIKVAIPKLQQDVAAVQTAANGPSSPSKQAPTITKNITAFQKELTDLQKRVKKVETIKSALASSQGLQNAVQAVAGATSQDQLKKTYQAYDALLGSLDDVEIKPLLSATRRALLDAAGVLDNVLEIRDDAGTLAKVIIQAPIASSVKGISKSLHAIASDLNTIIQGGKRSLRASAPALASSFITNSDKISQLVTALQATAKALPAHIAKMKQHVDAMTQLKDKLTTTASSIGTRLESKMKEKVKTVKGTFDAPRAAAAELKTIMNTLKAQINGIFANARDAVAQAGDGILVGVNGIGAFKKTIGFEVVPELAQKGYAALPASVKSLSENIDRLRKALPLEATQK